MQTRCLLPIRLPQLWYCEIGWSSNHRKVDRGVEFCAVRPTRGARALEQGAGGPDFRASPECELRLSRFSGSCASHCNSSYSSSLINSRRGIRVSPSLKEEVA